MNNVCLRLPNITEYKEFARVIKASKRTYVNISVMFDHKMANKALQLAIKIFGSSIKSMDLSFDHRSKHQPHIMRILGKTPILEYLDMDMGELDVPGNIELPILPNLNAILLYTANSAFLNAAEYQKNSAT
jgi:hypothetical protein